MPQVSVLMPVFNGAAFLDEQLRSILDQSFADFELLIYDDGSADTSWDIAESFAKQDRRITSIVRSSNNDGQGYALSRLLEKASSQRIMFADQDDIWAPGKIEELVRAVAGHSLAYGMSKLIDDGGRDLDCTIFDFVGQPISGRNRVDLFFANTVSGHALIADRAAIDPMALRLNSSYDRNIALAASFIGGVIHTPLSVTFHRLHDSNQLNSTIAGKPRLPLQNRPERASRHEQLLRFLLSLRCLSGMSGIDANSRNVFREMAKLAQERLSEFRSIYYTNRTFHTDLLALAGQLTDDHQALDVFRKKSLRMARGALYPTLR